MQAIARDPEAARTQSTPPHQRTRLSPSIRRHHIRRGACVQLGLLAYGYYDGPINGVVGPQMKKALKQFQASFHMKETGTITPEVLDALKVSAQ